MPATFDERLIEAVGASAPTASFVRTSSVDRLVNSRRHLRLVTVLAAILCVSSLAVSAGASASEPADQPPFAGGEAGRQVDRARDDAPRGFRLDAAQALAIAAGTEAWRQATDEYGTLLPEISTIGRDWEVRWLDSSGRARALVLVGDSTGAVSEQWTGWQVETRLARGYPGAVGGIVGSWWIWIPMCLLFLAPFVDLRRPLQIRHLDLLVLLAFGISFYFFARGRIDISVPLVYPLLGYLFARLCWIGFARGRGAGSIIDSGNVLLRERTLAVGTGLLALGYLLVSIFAAKVIDVGFASVIGAHLIAVGEPLYGVASSSGQPLLVDVYGPVNYLGYLPFERVFPWNGVEWDSLPAARAASLVFTLATAGCLYGLGRRVTGEARGRLAGLALAFAWLAFPFTLLSVASSFNDSLVALLVAASLLAISSAAGRGALTALAGMTKYGPLAIAPLMAGGTGERRLRSLIPFALAFIAVAVLVTVPLIPDGGIREIYDRSLGYQAGRGSPFSIWGQDPSLDALQTVAKVFAALFAVALYFIPRRRDLLQVAALASASLIALEVCAMHWFYSYLLWILPGALIAFLLAGLRSGGKPASSV